jgi:hypothetical protein
VLVYVPLGAFAIGLALVVGKILTGPVVWLVGLLGLYCVVPARLILETQRKGLELPKPPSAQRRKKPAPRARPPVRAAGAKEPSPVRERIERPRRPPAPRKSPQVIRRRALASIIGIGVLLLVGGILVIVGIGRVTSSFGLIMVGVGGFLMILSVTLPTFRLVDALLRGIGRLLSRRPAQPRPKPGD